MNTFAKIETTIYAILWAFAFYVIFQDVISPREVEARPEPVRTAKLTARDVIKGDRRAANR